MIERNEIFKILEDYNLDDITIGVLGSHSALDISRGAKEFGFKTLVVCQRGRDKTYAKYYKSRKWKGVVDEVILLDKFSEITNPEVIEKMQSKNTIFLPHRSFEVYVGFEKIENEFKIPLFGSRNMLRAEERYVERNQYYLMEKGGIPYPRVYEKTPLQPDLRGDRLYKGDNIDMLVIVKVAEKQRTYERAFFFASNGEEYSRKAQELIKKDIITPDALQEAVIEEFVLGTQFNLNFFYSPVNGELELLGVDTRRQTNLDGLLRLPAQQQIQLLDSSGEIDIDKEDIESLYDEETDTYITINPQHIIGQEARSIVDIKAIEAGHIACTVKESLLEQIFELGEKFVNVSKQEYPPGIIGTFALQCALTPGPPKEKFVCFDISMRVQGSPGTAFTPYSGYLYEKSLSVGEKESGWK